MSEPWIRKSADQPSFEDAVSLGELALDVVERLAEMLRPEAEERREIARQAALQQHPSSSPENR